MFQTEVVEKLNAYILCPITCCFENRAAYDIKQNNVVDTGRPQMSIWRKRNACWIPKAKSTHSDYVIVIAFPLQQWFNERVSLLRYTFIACLVWNHFCQIKNLKD
jgi:hypothetical protein